MPLPMIADAAARTRWIVGASLVAGLLLVLRLQLFSALFSALLSYGIAHALLVRLSRRMPPRRATLLAVVLTAALLALLVAGAASIAHGAWAPHGGLAGLLNLLADFLDRLRESLPAWIRVRLPESVGELQDLLAGWLRSNAHDVRSWGQDALRILAHVFIGLTIGLLSALQHVPAHSPPWVRSTADGLQNLARSFVDVAASQLRIAAVNAVLTAVFLLVALPAAGVSLPLAPTLAAFTFVAGLVPIIGNLLSNGAILIVALTVSPGVALAALLFLVGIHKLEYVLNAHIVSGRTSVPAPVLLAAMLVLEAAFGLAGLLAAPIYCAWAFRQFAVTGDPAPAQAGGPSPGG